MEPDKIGGDPLFQIDIHSELDCHIVFLGFVSESFYKELSSTPSLQETTENDLKSILYFIFSATERNFFLQRIENLKMQTAQVIGKKNQGRNNCL